MIIIQRWVGLKCKHNRPRVFLRLSSSWTVHMNIIAIFVHLVEIEKTVEANVLFK